MDDDDPVRPILRALEREGLRVRTGGSAGTYVVGGSADRRLAHEPTLVLPPDLLRDYVRSMETGGTSASDAAFLARMHVVEELTTDHGGGVNHVRRIWLRRAHGGRVELMVDKSPPDPPEIDDGVRLGWTVER